MTTAAVTARVQLARGCRGIPGMIVVGGTAAQRHDVVVDYVLALAEAQLLRSGDCGWIPEPVAGSLSRRAPDQPATTHQVWQHMTRHPLVIITELGADADPAWRPTGYTDRLHGARPILIDTLADDRYNRSLPLVVTTPLAAGHRPGAAEAQAADRQRFAHDAAQFAGGGRVITMTGPDMATRTTLAERDSTGWVIPGPAGFDPDGRIVEADAPTTLQEYLGEHTWWRLYKNAIGTAVDATTRHPPRT